MRFWLSGFGPGREVCGSWAGQKVDSVNMARNVVVCGTGTEIGKTFVASALCRALRSAGVSVAGLKPVESGVSGDDSGDGAILREASSVAVAAGPYRFAKGVSPHLAAREAGVDISVERIAQWVHGHAGDVRVVELAGGLLSPLAVGVTNLDAARAVGGALVAVGCDRLGVLHDVAALMRCLGGGDAGVGVALSAPERPDASTGTNAVELVRAGVISSEVVVFPRRAARDPAVAESAGAVLRRLGLV